MRLISSTGLTSMREQMNAPRADMTSTITSSTGKSAPKAIVSSCPAEIGADTVRVYDTGRSAKVTFSVVVNTSPLSRPSST